MRVMYENFPQCMQLMCKTQRKAVNKKIDVKLTAIFYRLDTCIINIITNIMFSLNFLV